MESEIKFRNNDHDSFPLWQSLLGQHWNIDSSLYRDIIAEKYSFGAFHLDELIGVIYYDINSTSQQAAVVLLVVAEKFQKQGIGKELLKQALLEIKKQGVSKVVLADSGKGGFWRALPTSLKAAQQFFSSQGWQFSAASPDQTGSIQEYRSPAFLDIRPRRKDIIYRFFTPQDREQLLAFEKAHFPHWAVYFENFINAQHHNNIVVVEKDSIIIGACLIEYPGQQFMGSNWVNMLGHKCGSPSVLGVAEAYRGFGIGYYLFDFAMKVLSENGAEHAFINESDAPHVYKRFGFEVIWEYVQGSYQFKES